MKKIALILVILSIFIIISYVVMNSVNINQNIREPYQPPICGNNICEESEESYCLDCNLSCKSELCNLKINVICDNCTETQKKLLPLVFENQNIVYDCLADYYGYHPPRLIYHTITEGNINISACTKKEGCYSGSGGLARRNGVRQGFIPGLREYGENDVTKEENVGFEIHETAHIFTHLGLGKVPIWFNEGISIYTEGRVLCDHPNYKLLPRLDSFLSSYEKLKSGEKTLDELAPYGEYYRVEHSAHIIGAMYFGALEQDYDCDKKCIAKILYSLHEYRENCTESCFENAKKSIPQLMNFSLNNNDLRVPIITNKIIKQISEKVVNQDLTLLLDMLEINYTMEVKKIE